MRFGSLLILICLALASVAQASDALEHDFEVANSLYQQGDYTGALENYRKVAASGVDNAVLHYNIGNSFFKTGQLGEAIASYHKALRFDPRNDDIRANLRFAKQQMIDKIDPTAVSPLWMWYKSLVLNYTANEWAVMSSVLLFLLLFMLIYIVWTRNRQFVVKSIAVGLLVLFVCSGICTGVNVRLNFYSPRGAIVVPEVSIKAGPGEDFGEQFVAHEGLTFDILKQESGWYLGVFDNRLKGWIRVSDAAKI